MKGTFALFLAIAFPATAQDIGLLRACVEGLGGPDVAECRGAYIVPCLASNPSFPTQCHSSESRLRAEQIRRSASLLVDWAGDDRFDAVARRRANDFWRSVHTEIQANDEACADVRFVDMVESAFSNAAYHACVMDGHEVTLTSLRQFMAEFP